MTEEKIQNDRPGNWWALSPLLVFLCLTAKVDGFRKG